MKIERKPTKVLAEKLWHTVQVWYCMFYKTISKHKLMLDLNLRLLLGRSKVARKAIGRLLSTSHHHHHHHHHRCHRHHSKLHCLPQEDEFSNKGKHHDIYDHVSDIASIFEILNSNEWAGDDIDMVACFLTPTVRPLRVTDSPFLIKEEDGEGGSQVDREAEEFIRRFYEQLWLQERRAKHAN